MEEFYILKSNIVKYGFIVILALIFSVGFGSNQHLMAQDFEQLLNAVEKVETNLKKLIEAESKSRSLEIARLEAELKKIKSSPASTDNVKLDALSAKLESLSKQLSESKAQSTAPSVGEKDILAIRNDVEALRGEVVQLEKLFNQNAELLAGVSDEDKSSSSGEMQTVKNDVQYLKDELLRLVNVLSKNSELLTEMKSENIAGAKVQEKKDVEKKSSKKQGPKTTVNGRIYVSTYFDNTEGADNFSEFTLNRSYVTVKSKLSKSLSARITTDFKEKDNVFNILLKYAYFDWKPDFAQGYVKGRFGLQATQYIDNMNKLWGRRYLEKTFGDKESFLTSSDFGFSVITGFGKKSEYGFASVAILNGTKYSGVEELNKHKDFNLVALVKPLKEVSVLKKSVLMLQIYSGTQNKEISDDIYVVDTLTNDTTFVESSDWKRNIFSVGGLVAHGGYYDVGFDLNFTTQGKGVGKDEVKKSGLSFFGTFYLKNFVNKDNILKHLNFFGRLDVFDPNTDADDDNETLTIFGVESKPVKGFNVSLNYRTVSFEDDSPSEKNIYINTQFKF